LRKNIGVKAARKMLMKLATARNEEEEKWRHGHKKSSETKSGQNKNSKI